MAKNNMKRKQGKENAAPISLTTGLLEEMFEDVNDIVGRRSEIGKRSLCLFDSDGSISDVVIIYLYFSI